MKPEPLTKDKIMKEKIIRQPLDESYKHEFLNFYVYLDDVKSAVGWLLKEIEKEKQKAEKRMDDDYFRGLRNGYIVAIELTKKAFEGVIEE